MIVDDIKKIISPNKKFDSYPFLHGGCYVFAKIIQQITQNSNLYLDKESEHCVVEVDGKLMDANGYISNKNRHKYKKMNEDDEKYCLSHYILFKTKEDNINYIDQIIKQYFIHNKSIDRNNMMH